MARSKLPLRGISVFTTVARLGSFKAAASELNLTASAVSHQIRALEEELGVELFKRVSRGVVLLPEAAKFAVVLDELFERMLRATADIAAPGWQKDTTEVVRIMTTPSLATHWLMPRLPSFIEAHPDVDLRVFAVRTADGNADDFDITVRYGDAARWKATARPLLKEIIQPYCSPKRLGGATSLTPKQLLGHPLIGSRENDVSWDVWFSDRGISLKTGAVQKLQVDPSYVAIEAAVKGIGVILESNLLTEEHVQAGRLVAPIREVRAAATAYWLLPLRKGARQSVVTAHGWLIQQANLTGGS